MNSIPDRHRLVSKLYDEAEEFYEEREWHKIWVNHELCYVIRTILNYSRSNDVNILDIGCGTGIYLEQLKNFGFKNFYGIDISKRMLSKAKKRIYSNYKDEKERVINADILNIPFPDSFFNITFSIRTFSHVFNKLTAIKEISRVSKKDGYFILVDIHDSHSHQVKMKYKDKSISIPTAGYLSRKSYNNLFTKYAFKEKDYSVFRSIKNLTFKWSNFTTKDNIILFQTVYQKIR